MFHFEWEYILGQQDQASEVQTKQICLCTDALMPKPWCQCCDALKMPKPWCHSLDARCLDPNVVMPWWCQSLDAKALMQVSWCGWHACDTLMMPWCRSIGAKCHEADALMAILWCQCLDDISWCRYLDVNKLMPMPQYWYLDDHLLQPMELMP